MDTNSLTYKTLKNVTYRFLSFTWPMIFSILITPIIVLKLGAKDYGIYIFISTVTSLLGLLDLGVSYAVVKYLAEYHAQADTEKTKRLIYSANSLFLLVGVAGFLATVGLYFGGAKLFASRLAGQQYLMILFLLAGGGFLLNSLNQLYALVPDAIQRFDISSKLNIVYLTLSSLGNLVLVLLGYRLISIFVFQLLLTFIFFFIRRYYAVAILPIAKYRLNWNREEIKRCYRFGLATVINNTASTSLAYLDRLIIPIFIGPAQLTYYSLPGNVAARIPGVTDNLSGIIFPVSAGMAGTGDKERINRFYIRSVRLITLLASAISLSVIFLSHQILQYWLNADFANRSTGVLIILTLTNLTIALLSPITAFFFGLGKLKFSTALSLVMAMLNALFLFVLLPRYGIMGAAWAYLLSVLPIFYMIYFIEQKYLKLPGRGRYHTRTIAQIGITALVFFFIVKFLITPIIFNFVTLAVGGPLAVIIFIALFWLFGFLPNEDRNDMKRFLHLIGQRFSPPKKKEALH